MPSHGTFGSKIYYVTLNNYRYTPPYLPKRTVRQGGFFGFIYYDVNVMDYNVTIIEKYRTSFSMTNEKINLLK